jgi:hypothetical protein
MYVQEQEQVKLLNSLHRLLDETLRISKTLIAYDYYESIESNSINLETLHTLAKVLLDPTLEVEVEPD